MQQTTFDENGYLVPYDVIEMNLADFETHFAITQHRKFLFENKICDERLYSRYSSIYQHHT